MSEPTNSRVRILGLRVSKRAEDGNSEPGMVAVLDAKIPGATLFGATLWRRRDGQMTISPPSLGRGEGNGVRIDDPELKADLCAAACTVARMFGANVEVGPVLSKGFSEIAENLLQRSLAAQAEG